MNKLYSNMSRYSEAIITDHYNFYRYYWFHLRVAEKVQLYDQSLVWTKTNLYSYETRTLWEGTEQSKIYGERLLI